jgi:bacillithiol system protein YtxJ
LKKSFERPQVIFKHSIRCAVSSVIKSRLEGGKAPSDIDFYYLDLVNYRALSNKIADDLHVSHESPQILLIRNGECVYDESHIAIRMKDIEAEVMLAD